jgi:hypothetical protein
VTHINLMIDQTFGKPVADALNDRTGAIKAATTIEYGFVHDAPDKELISQTDDLKCLLLTHDKNTIDLIRYPPCTHGGIIIFKPKHWSPENVTAAMYAFCLSGNRKDAAHCVTWLYHDRALIHTHTEQVLVRF